MRDWPGVRDRLDFHRAGGPQVRAYAVRRFSKGNGVPYPQYSAGAEISRWRRGMQSAGGSITRRCGDIPCRRGDGIPHRCQSRSCGDTPATVGICWLRRPHSRRCGISPMSPRAFLIPMGVPSAGADVRRGPLSSNCWRRSGLSQVRGSPASDMVLMTEDAVAPQMRRFAGIRHGGHGRGPDCSQVRDVHLSDALPHIGCARRPRRCGVHRLGSVPGYPCTGRPRKCGIPPRIFGNSGWRRKLSPQVRESTGCRLTRVKRAVGRPAVAGVYPVRGCMHRLLERLARSCGGLPSMSS